MEAKIRYCALATISASIRSFILPSAIHLAENGYDVTIGCQKDDKLAADLPANLHYLPLGIERGFSIKGTLIATWQLYRFFCKEKIQMVEYGTENVSLCASIAAWAARVPIRIYNHWGARYIGYTGLARQFSLLIERTAALFSTTIRQQSQKNMQMCINDKVYSAKKVSVIGYGGTVGADFKRFDLAQKDAWNKVFRQKHSIPMDDIVFGDIGYIRKDKGHEELLTAFRNICNEHTWLVLVGDIFEPDAPKLELMEWAKQSNRVIFTGRVCDVEHYAAAYDVIVHPSYREGLGMVLQEAGALGVPYIACDIPGPGEIGINGETGLLVEKGNATDLQEKMQYLLDHPEIIRKMSKAMFLLTKERYERNKMLQRILDDRNKLKLSIKS